MQPVLYSSATSSSCPLLLVRILKKGFRLLKALHIAHCTTITAQHADFHSPGVRSVLLSTYIFISFKRPLPPPSRMNIKYEPDVLPACPCGSLMTVFQNAAIVLFDLHSLPSVSIWKFLFSILDFISCILATILRYPALHVCATLPLC